MRELMILVERAVRPVRADGARKYRMRQELLAHLTERFEAERAHLGDDAAALEETARRFGDPAEVTRELQGVVPAYERVAHTPIPGLNWLERRVRGPAGRWNFSAALFAALGAGGNVLVFLPLYAARVSGLQEWPRIVLSLGGIVVQTGAAFVVNYLIIRLFQIAIVAGWAATARKTLSYGAAIVVIQMLSVQALSSFFPNSGLAKPPQVVVATVAFVVLVPLVTRFIASRWHHSSEWRSLEIGP